MYGGYPGVEFDVSGYLLLRNRVYEYSCTAAVCQEGVGKILEKPPPDVIAPSVALEQTTSVGYL